MSSVSNGLYFLTLPLVSLGARYTLGARYLSKNTVYNLHSSLIHTQKLDYLIGINNYIFGHFIRC